jgi:hypothetical protein
VSVGWWYGTDRYARHVFFRAALHSAEFRYFPISGGAGEGYGMTSGDGRGQEPERLDRRRLALSLLATPLLLDLLLFLPAGTWAWGRGWLFGLVFLLAFTLAALYLWRVNPEVVVARSRSHQGTKGWDRILLGFWLLAFVAIFPGAALFLKGRSCRPPHGTTNRKE